MFPPFFFSSSRCNVQWKSVLGSGFILRRGEFLIVPHRPWSRNFERKGRLTPLLLRRLQRRRGGGDERDMGDFERGR